MRTHFAEVLALEEASLADVTHVAGLARWRRRVVRELMDPRSPYVLALRQTGELRERADFLARWRSLIAEMVDRLLHSKATEQTASAAACPPARSRHADDAAQETAVLILAALHGGSTLSQVVRDPWPLNAALDLALARLAPPGGGAVDDERNE